MAELEIKKPTPRTWGDPVLDKVLSNPPTIREMEIAQRFGVLVTGDEDKEELYWKINAVIKLKYEAKESAAFEKWKRRYG